MTSHPATNTYRIFVSSTYVDLHAHRAKVKEALERLDQHPVVMENFTAHDGDPASVATDTVATCEVYVGLVAWRYGTIPPGDALGDPSGIRRGGAEGAGRAGRGRRPITLRPVSGNRTEGFGIASGRLATPGAQFSNAPIS